MIFQHFVIFLTGPFAFLFIYPFERNMFYMSNIGVGLSKQVLWSYQYVNSLANLICLLLYCFYNSEGYLNGSVLLGLLITSFLRSFIIAYRYAVMQDTVYEKYYTKILDREEIISEFLIQGWTNAHAKHHEAEIKASMARLEVENKFFRLKWFVKVDFAHREYFLNY